MRKLFLGVVVAALFIAPTMRASADAGADRAAAQQIAQNMKSSGILKNYRVGVRYQEGVAVIEGSVTSADQKTIAEAIARNSEGVDRVVSRLTVDDGSATVASNDIERALHTTPTRQSQRPAPLAARQRQGAANASAQGAERMPVPFAHTTQPSVQPAGYGEYGGLPNGGMGMQPQPMSHVPQAVGRTVSYDNPQVPAYAWPSYAANPNYAALTYPQQYSPSAWPYIGPFYPYPQVPLGWRKVTLEWDDGWWFLDFKDCKDCY